MYMLINIQTHPLNVIYRQHIPLKVPSCIIVELAETPTQCVNTLCSVSCEPTTMCGALCHPQFLLSV